MEDNSRDQEEKGEEEEEEEEKTRFAVASKDVKEMMSDPPLNASSSFLSPNLCNPSSNRSSFHFSKIIRDFHRIMGDDFRYRAHLMTTTIV